MSNEKVIVTKSKLDALATSISNKSGVATPLTIAQMKAAVDGIVGGTITQDEDGYIVLSEGGEGITANVYLNKDLSGDVIYTGSSLLNVMLRGQKYITSISLPNVGNVDWYGTNAMPYYAFADMPALISFSAPKLKRIANYMLQNCVNLSSVDMPLLEDSGISLFYGCTSLQNVVFKSMNVIYQSTFRHCTNLEIVDVKLATGFTNASNFDGCTKLKTIIIRTSDNVPTLFNINNFTNSPFASGGTGGTLYVPSALISSYQSATNWSTILSYTNNQILPIEGSIYETQYADGTPISS